MVVSAAAFARRTEEILLKQIKACESYIDDRLVEASREGRFDGVVAFGWISEIEIHPVLLEHLRALYGPAGWEIDISRTPDGRNGEDVQLTFTSKETP